MTQNIGQGRFVTMCTSCRQADDHPKHKIALTDDAVGKHLDCCNSDGCPDGSCQVILGDANPKPGKGMLDHIQKQHQRRDVARELEQLHEQQPELRGFHAPGQQAVRLNPSTGEAR